MNNKQRLEMIRNLIDLGDEKAKLLEGDTWKLLMMYSGFDRYYGYEEIAKEFGITADALNSRFSRLRQSHKDLMDNLKDLRHAIKSATLRQERNSDRQVEYKDAKMSEQIMEKF